MKRLIIMTAAIAAISLIAVRADDEAEKQQKEEPKSEQTVAEEIEWSDDEVCKDCDVRALEREILHLRQSREMSRKIMEARGGVRVIEVKVSMFSVPDKAYAELKLDDPEAWVDATAVFRAVSKRPDAKRLGSVRTVTQSGNEVVAKSVREVSYPTDFDIQVGASSSDDNAKYRRPIAVSEPQSFTMREVGMIANVTPTVVDWDDSFIDLDANVYFTGEPEWKDYGAEIPVSDANDCDTYKVAAEQPFFPVCSHNVSLTVRSGDPELFCAPEVSSGDEPSGRMVLTFVTVTNMRR